jgi:hypothetical protein
MKCAWSKFPSRWIREGALRDFRSDGALGCAAALKLYMALAMFASFKPSPTAEVAGAVRLSFSELEALCDISRRYVSLGLAMLARRELITIQSVGNANSYVINGYDEIGWAKLPRGHLLEGRRFKAMSIRGALYLDALQLYLTLLTFRHNNSHEALLSYDKIEHYTDIPRRHIRRAIDVLLNHEWASIASNPVESSNQRSANIYVLRGDFWGRAARNISASTPGTASQA